jgi:hypothetical protein
MHGRHKAIGKSCHVPHARAIGGLGHVAGVWIIHGERLLTKHVFPSSDSGEGGGAVGNVRGGDDYGVNIIPPNDLLVIGGGGLDTGFLAGALQSRGIGVAQGRDLHVGTEGESGQVVLKGNAAASDNANSKFLHGLSSGVKQTTFPAAAQAFFIFGCEFVVMTTNSQPEIKIKAAAPPSHSRIPVR